MNTQAAVSDEAVSVRDQVESVLNDVGIDWHTWPQAEENFGNLLKKITHDNYRLQYGWPPVGGRIAQLVRDDVVVDVQRQPLKPFRLVLRERITPSLKSNPIAPRYGTNSLTELPQTPVQLGETERQAASRVLKSLGIALTESEIAHELLPVSTQEVISTTESEFFPGVFQGVRHCRVVLPSLKDKHYREEYRVHNTMGITLVYGWTPIRQ